MSVDCAMDGRDRAPGRVLVVDPFDETRAVLETVLSRRGVEIVATTRRDEGLRLAREFQPDVVVLDCELLPLAGEATGANGAAPAGRPFASASPENPPSLVLLGNARRAEAQEAARYMQKPYLYGRLIRTIEELLAARRAA